jgi:hypothetical protein
MPAASLAFALAAGCLLAAVALTVIALRGDTPRGARGARLPHGADAALWSIVEAIPDPRNHLALTRDLSGEVHLTDADRAAARVAARAALAAKAPVRHRVPLRRAAPAPIPVRATAVAASAPEPAGGGVAVAERPIEWPARDDTGDFEPLVLRTKSPAEDHDYTEDAGADELTLSGQLFFAGPPELSPF